MLVAAAAAAEAAWGEGREGGWPGGDGPSAAAAAAGAGARTRATVLAETAAAPPLPAGEWAPPPRVVAAAAAPHGHLAPGEGGPGSVAWRRCRRGPGLPSRPGTTRTLGRPRSGLKPGPTTRPPAFRLLFSPGRPPCHFDPGFLSPASSRPLPSAHPRG